MITSYIYQSIKVRLSKVWGRPGLVLEILTMALYPGTGIGMCMSVFATYVSVSKKTQKNLGESTHTIIST